MRSRTTALLGLTVVLGAAAARPAAAQSTWANNSAAPNWNDPAAWNNNTVPIGAVATFPNTPTVNPVVPAGVTTGAATAFITNNGTAASYNILSGGAGSVLALTSTSSAQASAALNLLGGGVTRIDPRLQLNNGGFLYTTGGTILELAGGLATAAAGNAISFRTDGTSRVRLLSAADASLTGTVNMTTTGGSSGSRYELGADGALGTGPLTTNGGTGLAFSLIPIDPAGVNGITRTVGNSTVSFTPAITFGDTAGGAAAAANNSNSLAFTNAVFLGGTAIGNRALTVAVATNAANPVLSTSALRFNGATSLRAAGNATAGVNIVFQGNGRVEFNGVLSNGDAASNATAANLFVGTGNGPTTVRLSNPANTYSGVTNLQSGGLLVAADAPATGPGALGTPAAGSETITVGTAAGVTNRYLLLDVAANPVTVGRPIAVTTGPATPPITLLGTIGAGSNTGTYAGPIAVGTASSPNPGRLILNANSPTGVAQFNGTVLRNTGYTGDVTIQANATLGGYGGSGVVAFGGGSTQTAGLNAQVGVVGGTFRVDAGTTFDSGRGFYVGGGTAVVNGVLAAGTGPLAVGAGFSLNDPATITDTAAGTLAGTGAVSQPVTVRTGGTLAPGAGPAAGVLTANAAVTFNTGSVFQVNVTSGTTPAVGAANTGASSGATAGAANSRLVAGGNGIVLTGPNVAVDLTGVTLAEFADYSFVVATGTGITPAGTGSPTQVNVGTFTFTNSPLAITNPSLFVSIDSTQVYLNFTPVPEPATVLALAAGGLGLVRLRRRLTG